ncbi:hypothetical protein LCGC14_0452500 [marine sediment metagenome]|uniref:Uncharacterized protein n=1 Tax=marine sediment metagenome TaxID=412755 RepID=A0A0F9SN27_9ZZZZ
MPTNCYATDQELADKLGLDSDKKTRYQAQIDSAIETASRIIDTRTQTFFFIKTLTTEAIDVNGYSINELEISPACRSIIASAPIITVTALLESGVALSEKTVFAGTGDYFLKKSLGQIVKANGGRWSTGDLAISLSGTIGYAEVPKDIHEVALTFASVLTRLDNNVVVDQDGNSEGILQSILPEWPFELLDKYRRPVI